MCAGGLAVLAGGTTLGLVSVAGLALTFVLPEPARRSLEDMPASPSAAAPQPLRVADRASSP